MANPTIRILLGDTHPEGRAMLTTICQEQGWELTAVESSFQILRMLRDATDIALVMVDPELPGSGISGKEVAKTIKTSGQFGSLPVVFVLRPGVPAPDGVPVNGVIEITTASPTHILAAMRGAMGGVAAGRAEPVEEAPRAIPTTAASAAAAVAPVPLEAPAAHPVRILVADTVTTTRATLEPLCENHGWELILAESGFQALRVVRDTDLDLVLINPHLQAAGVSGADIARTIKGAAQFRKLPVLYLLHEGEAAPDGAKVDGAVEVDVWPAARLAGALTAAMRHSAGIVASGAAPAPPAGVPVDAATPLASAELRDDLLAEVRRIVDAALRAFAQIEGRTMAEEAVRRYAATEGRRLAEQLTGIARDSLPAALARLEQQEQVLTTLSEVVEGIQRGADAEPRVVPGEVVEAAVRRYLASEGRGVMEKLVAALARETVPALTEGLVRQEIERLPGPPTVEELLPQLHEPMQELARRAAETASRHRIEGEGRAVLEGVIRQFVAGEGRTAAERLVAALAREMLPSIAERVARQQLEQLASPAQRVEELLPQLREQVLETARRVAEAASRQQVESQSRAALEDAIRRYLASDGRDLAERIMTTLAGEQVPATAERLVQRELARLPNPAAQLEEFLARFREQLREDARQAVEGITHRYVETDGRAAVEEIIRQYATGKGIEVAEELIRSTAREVVPAIAERLAQRELERLPSPAAKLDELVAQLREQLREDARRAIEAVARRYAETDGRAMVESVIRQYVATQGVNLADDFVRSAAREIVPPIAERLVQREIGRLPAAAARIEEVLAQLREQLREDGRRAVEAIARRYAEAEGRGVIENAIRHQVRAPGGLADELVRSVAQEVVPAIAERLIRDEIARLRREHRPE